MAAPGSSVQHAPEVIVNLAAKNLGEQRWSSAVKRALVDSRVETTRRVLDEPPGEDSVPGLAMRILYGEMADLDLTGQKVMPCRHMDAGRVYRYPAIAQALAASV